jgi:hypothetical protein
VGVKLTSVDCRLLGLLGPYLRRAIGMFNTCSRGPTHWSLTDRSGGYNLGGAGFPHTTPRPSQPMVLHFPPKGPTQSQVIQSHHKHGSGQRGGLAVPLSSVMRWLVEGSSRERKLWQPHFAALLAWALTVRSRQWRRGSGGRGRRQDGSSGGPWLTSIVLAASYKKGKALVTG